jgi:hypothetical protein
MRSSQFCVALLISTSVAATAPLHVRVLADDRTAMQVPQWQNWRWQPEQASTRFGDVTVTISAGGSGAKVVGASDKALLARNLRLATAGVTSDAKAGGELLLTIRGLAPGEHTIATYHNEVRDAVRADYAISVDGQTVERAFKPSTDVASDYDVASTFFTVRAEAGKDVVVRIRTTDARGNVILNGFEIDDADPRKQAAKPSPANGDETVDPKGELVWSPASGAKTHLLYLGTDADAVANATRQSPEFKAELTAASAPLPKLDHMKTYFWRVDEVDAGGEPTRGEVWRFRSAFPAFPTAEGYGRFARGGRGGRVIEVTNLDDNDKAEPLIPGSLRAAIEAEGPRTVIFRTSGLVRLKRDLILRNGYVTVAGQTAPGDGICVANYRFGLVTNDAIVRFIRVRVGDFSRKSMDGLGLGSSNNSIIDHCSISWAMDEGTSSRGGHNITFQWNIISEMLQHGYHYNGSDRTKLETHAFAGSISGDIGSYHHNLLAHCTDRNWSLAGGLDQAGQYAGRLDIRNNVVYNWTGRTTDGGVKDLVYVNNYYKPYPKQHKFATWLLRLDKLNPEWGKERVYMSGNVMEGFDYDKDNWKAFQNGKDVMAQVRVDEPLWPSYVKEENAKDAYGRVLAGAGAIFPKRDVIDTRIAQEVWTGTVHYAGTKAAEWAKDKGHKNSPNVPGIIDTQDDVHDADDSPVKPWPNYKTYDVPADADRDGIPDAWESAHGLNPKDAADGNGDFNGDGYTNLEKYLNSLAGEYDPTKGK